MKKIIAIVLAVSSLFFLTATKVLAEWSAGVSMTQGLFAATGKETTAVDGEINTLPSTNLVEGKFTFPSVFVEKKISIVSIGLDLIPGSVDTEEQARTDYNCTPLCTGNDGGSTGITNKASVSISQHVSLYALVQPLTDIGAFVRVAVIRADVETKESLGTGSTYPDTTMRGKSLSIGYQHNFDSFFVRAEVGRSSYDTIKVISSAGHTVVADLDGEKWGKISIAKSF